MVGVQVVVQPAGAPIPLGTALLVKSHKINKMWGRAGQYGTGRDRVSGAMAGTTRRVVPARGRQIDGRPSHQDLLPPVRALLGLPGFEPEEMPRRVGRAAALDLNRIPAWITTVFGITHKAVQGRLQRMYIGRQNSRRNDTPPACAARSALPSTPYAWP